MDALPNLLPKILSECGVISLVLGVFCVWLAAQLANARKVSEADRASFMKIFNEQNAAYEKLAAANNTMQGILLAVQSRHPGDDG